MKRIISSILVLTTLVACLGILPFGAFAAAFGNGDVVTEIKPVMTNKYVNKYLTQSYFSAQDKLNRDLLDDGTKNMQLYATYGTKEIYASSLTGEVYIKDILTGDILTSNPYDMSSMKAVDQGKEIMSQLILSYKKVTDATATTIKMLTYTEAAERGQITIDPILNGIRVNYVIGNTTKRYLLPYGIMATDLLDLLYVPMHQQIEKNFREAAAESGVPEEDLNKYFDFEAYCKSVQSRYSTAKELGKEYTYGNIKAFEQWIRQISTFYGQFYDYEDYAEYYKGNDPQIERSEEEQAGMWRPKDLNALTDEYKVINQAYSYVTPYSKYDGDDPEKWTESDSIKLYPVLGEKTEMHPIYNKPYLSNAIFVLDSGTKEKPTAARILRDWETLFGKFVDGYTLSEAEESENETGITPPASDNPVFYVSLVYRLTNDGVDVSVPATSVMYDESIYTVAEISILPYMGTGNVYEDGYVFYPDGSGALIEYEDFRGESSMLSGKVYGQDYSYYTITGQHQKNIAMPVFGTVQADNIYEMRTPFKNANGEFIWVKCTYDQYTAKTYTIKYAPDDEKGGLYAVLPFGEKIYLESEEPGVYTTQVLDTATGFYKSKKISETSEGSVDVYSTVTTEIRAQDFRLMEDNKHTSGFLAIVEDGAALCNINASQTSARFNPYSSVYSSFAPRCEDDYNLADSVSSITDANAVFSVLSDDKFSGSYTTRFIMLTDKLSTAEEAEAIAFKAGFEGVTMPTYYAPSYSDMAKAYRDYLLAENLLPKSGITSEDLPLFIESFGVMQTIEKFLSIPFTVDVALTRFEDVKTMYEQLGIDNVKFRLTGFANGGMFPTYPNSIDWESEAGGSSDFEDLIEYANGKKNLEIFPNFDFMYIVNVGWFDGIDMQDVGVRSADNRYAMRKTYSSVYQTYTFSTTDGILVAANLIEDLFEDFRDDYSDYDIKTLSLASMASDLSSDFNEDNTLTRDEAMKSILGFFETATENYQLMSDGGNAYALKYMKYLLKAPIDSSHFRSTSRTVPFWGMVVHGYVEYAGGAFNEESNKRESLLRAIESGASLYFMLSYDNTRLLKDDLFLSDYYSVNYQISKETVKEYYNLLSEAIGDLTSYKIVDHRIVYAERVGIESEVFVQREEAEAEFLEMLRAEIDKQTTILHALMRALRGLNIDIDGVIATYDADNNGVLNGAEIAAAWAKHTDRNGVKKIAREYYSVKQMADIIGNVDLNSDDEDTRIDAEDTAGIALYTAIVNRTLNIDFGSTDVGVTFMDAAVLETARRHLNVDALEADFIADIRRVMAENIVEVNGKAFVAEIGTFTYTPNHVYFTTSSALDKDYKTTESTVSDGTVVMVTYSNGTDSVSFILNFNIFAVSLRLNGKLLEKNLGRYDYIRIEN